MALFELSILIFGVWIIFLILSKIINKLINKNQNKIENKPEEEIESQTKEENKEEIINFYEEPELPKTIEELRKEELKPNTNIEYIVVEKKNDNDMFTLDEYRQMRKILEMIKENENHKNL
jgi:flagellar biosynthesis/type III secretory pathway M-ring protein FliF/YscJ